MLQLYNGKWIPVNNAYSYYVDYLYGGEETLCFTLSAYDETYPFLREEVLLKEDVIHPNLYAIKKVNRIDDEVIFTAELYMDEWKSNKPYKDTKNDPGFQTKTLSELLEYIKPAGWTVQNANITVIRRTPELEGVNAYDVLTELRDIFQVAYEIDTLNKKITVLDPDQVVDKGLYLHNELNLKEVVEKGDSSNFINRLYAYGKDNLTFSSINGNKEYIEDLSYKETIVTGYWKDERYTVKENLLEDAKKKLKDVAYPIKSYIANIVDLAKNNPDYAFLTIRLYDLVHLFINNEVEVLEKVVKYREYKLENESYMNAITLSTSPQQLTNRIDKIVSILGEDGQKFKGSILQQAQQAATELINSWSQKGYVYMTENEIYILDKLPKETAKYCIRINLGGIAFSQQGWQGPYVSAWTIDGKFNADFITAGTLKAINVEGVNIKGGNININNKFKVDSNGNMVVSGGGKFNGDITGGTITGETTINVGTDLIVGDNAYIGQNQSSEADIYKYLYFSNKSFIERIKARYEQLRMYTEGTIKLQSKVSDYNSVIDSAGNSISLGIQKAGVSSRETYIDFYNNQLNLYGAGGVLINHKIPVTTNNDKSGVIYLAYFDGAKEYLEITTKNGIAYGVDIWESDSRLKKNIINADVSALSVLREIQHHEFDWIKGGHIENGYVAQELELINDRFVLKVPQNPDSGGMDYKYQINSSAIIPYLSKSIQELDSIVKRQQKEIDELKKLVKEVIK